MLKTEWVFWVSLGLIIYTYAGYPILLSFFSYLNRLMLVPRRTPKTEPPKPTVSVVLVIRNEDQEILGCIENLLQSDYGNLDEVLVICDRRVDHTGHTGPVKAGETGPIEVGGIEQWVRVVELEKGREGRAAALNQAVAIAKGDIVVFTDIEQRFEKNTISLLVAPFIDKKVGAVSGILEAEPSDEEQEMELDVCLRLENFIRVKESEVGSTIGCSGAVYAVRGDAYRAIRDDTILDEVVIPMKIALSGYRVLFEPKAKAYDPNFLDRDVMRSRKVHALAGNWQMLFGYPTWLLNRLTWQLVSHKYLRLIGPVFMVTTLAGNLLMLDQHWMYWLILIGQVVGYILGIVGLYGGSFRWKRLAFLSRASSSFLRLQVEFIAGFIYWIKGPSEGPEKGEEEGAQIGAISSE